MVLSKLPVAIVSPLAENLTDEMLCLCEISLCIGLKVSKDQIMHVLSSDPEQIKVLHGLKSTQVTGC